MQPTDEQRDAVELFSGGLRLAIEAGAGAGKTSTLVMMANAERHRRMQYVAFNKAIVNDAGRKLPRNATARTAHSLAMRAVGREYQHRLESARMRSYEIAQLLGVDPIVVPYNDKPKVLQPSYLASLALRAIRNYCFSGDAEPGPQHVPYIEGIDQPDAQFKRTWRNNDDVRAHIAPAMRKAWEDLQAFDGKLPFSHDHYLKIWERSTPKIPADVVLFDEAQDASPVMLSIVAQQTHAQLVYVGDSQQQIYSWRGAENALQSVEFDARAHLTQCQPTGTRVRRVRQINGRQWTFDEVPIEQLVIGDRVVSWRPGRGTRAQGCVINHVAVRRHDGPIVSIETDQATSRYALNHHCVVRLGEGFRGRHMVYLMRRGDHFRVGRCPAYYTNSAWSVAVRARAEQADAVWVLSIHDSQAESALAEQLTQHRFGLPGVSFVNQSHYVMPLDVFWEKIGDQTVTAAECLSHFGLLLDHPLMTRTSGLSKRAWDAPTLPSANGALVTAAANVRDGMLCCVLDDDGNESWRPVTVRREWYTGSIWSLSVESDHTYVGDGIVTHNSFRFGHAIADIANVVLDTLDAEIRLRGWEPIDSRVGMVSQPRCVLTRTNAVAMRTVLRALAESRRVHLVGGGDEIVRFCKAAIELQDGSTQHPELACFSSWREVIDYVADDPSGDELGLMVALIEEFGADTIIDALERSATEGLAETVVSTAHKAKGREWESVQLADDFPEVSPLTQPEQWRLLYVACTRAQQRLDITRCMPLLRVLSVRSL